MTGLGERISRLFARDKPPSRAGEHVTSEIQDAAKTRRVFERILTPPRKRVKKRLRRR